MRLKLVRKASWRTVANAPTARIRTVIRTSGNAPLNLPILTPSSPALSVACLSGTGPRADDRLDDPAFPELVAGDLVDDPTARHHDDPVAEAGELERVARLDDRGDALLRLLPQRVVDVEPRGDVDALGRLLGQDDLDVSAQERSRQRDLLLIPARERLHRLLDRRRPDARGAARARRPCAARACGSGSRAVRAAAAPGSWRSPGRSGPGRATRTRGRRSGARPRRGVARAASSSRAACPSQVAVPVARSAPASARRNCTCPLPSAPAIPTISPLATSRSIGPNRSPRSPETASSTSRSRLTLVSRRKRELERTPDHESDEALPPTSRPPRTSPGTRRRGER